MIGRVFHKFVIVWRIKRKRAAADLIQDFFQEVYDVSKLMKLVKKFRYSGIKNANTKSYKMSKLRSWILKYQTSSNGCPEKILVNASIYDILGINWKYCGKREG